MDKINSKKIQIQETVYLCCSEKKILFYCYYAGYVLNIKEIIFYKDFKNIDFDNISIILHQSQINEFLSFKFKKKNKKIYIFLSNGYIDYLKYKKKINELKLRGYDISVITQEEWFEYKDINHYSLNSLIINKKNTLKKIRGVSYKKKIKYYYPLFSSIFNALVNIKFSIPFLINSKIVYVGRASLEETVETLDSLLNSATITEYLYNKILNNLNKSNQKGLFELIDDYEFKNLNFIYQYLIFNLLIRFLIISHLTKFKNFYHKTNKLFNFELLRTNIYKKIFHIDLGVKPGNSFVGDRTIYLERFFEKKYLKFNLFDVNVNYKTGDNFKNRLFKIENFLKKLYVNKNFDLSYNDLKKWLITINDDFKQ